MATPTTQKVVRRKKAQLVTKEAAKAARPPIVATVHDDPGLPADGGAPGSTSRDRIMLRNVKQVLDAQPHFRVIIQPTEAHDGSIDDSDVPISFRGYTYNVQRGKEVILPETIVEGLRNAKIETQKHEVDPTGRVPTRIVDVEMQRYPFSVLGPAKRPT